jgi:hypothetical protein
MLHSASTQSSATCASAVPGAMLRRLIFGLMKRLTMSSSDRATGYVIRCHIAGIVSRLAIGMS